jgi:septum formation inhibitor MinC
MIKSPYTFNEGAASKIAGGLGKRVNSAVQFYGKVKAAPLKAEEKAQAAVDRASAKKTAFEEGHADKVSKATEMSNARSTGARALAKERARGVVSVEKARQQTEKEKQNTSAQKAKEKATPRAAPMRAATAKTSAVKSPPAKAAAKPAAIKSPVKNTDKDGVLLPINKRPKPIMFPSPKLNKDAQEQYGD